MLVWLAAAGSLFVVLSACVLISVIGVGLMWKDDSKDGSVAKGKNGEDSEKGSGSEVGNWLPPAGPILMKETPGSVVKLDGFFGAAGRWGPVTTVVFTADGKRAIARRFQHCYPCELEDRIQRPKVWSIPSADARGVLAMSPDGKRIAGCTYATVWFFDANTYKKEDPPAPLGGECTAVYFRPIPKFSLPPRKLQTTKAAFVFGM